MLSCASKKVPSLTENNLPQRLCSLEESEFLFKQTHKQMLFLTDDSSCPKCSNQTVLQGKVGSDEDLGFCW